MIEMAVSTFLGGFIRGGVQAVMVCYRISNGHIHSPRTDQAMRYPQKWHSRTSRWIKYYILPCGLRNLSPGLRYLVISDILLYSGGETKPPPPPHGFAPENLYLPILHTNYEYKGLPRICQKLTPEKRLFATPRTRPRPKVAIR